MTATLLNECTPGAAPAAPQLPNAFRAAIGALDEPVHGQGELREIFPRTARRSRPDPIALLPGDYLLGEGEAPSWLRVEFAAHEATGSQVHTTSGLRVFVPAGRPVWVWRAADVMAWMVLSESAGAR